MYKNILAKYTVVFMVIISMCFLTTAIMTAFKVSDHSQEKKHDIISNSASVAKQYIESDIDDTVSNEKPMDDYLAESKNRLLPGLRAFASYSDDIKIMITDHSGKVLIVVNNAGEAEKPQNAYLPEETVKGLTEGNKSDNATVVGGGLDDQTIAEALPIMLDDGKVYGFAVVSADPDGMSELSQIILKIALISCISVMLVAVIVVYLITINVTKPLMEINKAAKSFAAGDYSVRVHIKGKDEVSDLADAFNDMATKLQSSEKLLSKYMADVSHDLKAPMTAISGFVDGILDGAIPPEQYDHYLNIISVEVKRLSRLVGQLLDISKIEAEGRKFNMQPFDICEMGRCILISFEHSIDEKKINVEFNCDNDNMLAMGDRDAIYQVFYNICDNALKYSCENGKLTVKISKADKSTLCVSVRNEGQGILPDELPCVFERFYKCDKSRGLEESGTGLGMYIAKTIIDAHKQTIKVDSVYGEYCEFSFTLAIGDETL